MNRALKLAIEKFNDRKFFECHDVLEDYWFECRREERDFYRGLLHFAVAFYHLLDKNNSAGAKLQFKKCIERLKSYGNIHNGINCRKIIRTAEENLKALETDNIKKINVVKINY